MLLGRSAELTQLNHYYDKKGSQAVVLYGQKNIGKTALLKEFSKGKPVGYYMARSCSEKEQVCQWYGELGHQAGEKSVLSYETVFSEMVRKHQGKNILIIEEFQNLLKAGSTFMQELASFLREYDGEVLVILCSSSVGWVENSMVRKMGEKAYLLSGLLKLKELKFKDCMQFFPHFTKQESIEVYAILGGFPGLWMYFDDCLSVRENIINSLLKKSGPLFGEAKQLLTEELRETAVYNTILASLAKGIHKLNDLYLHTGFSRAKISVYLKNLMELEIVEKVFSYDTEGYENVQKGMYRISNRFLHFYYQFLYPYMSSLQIKKPEDFYRDFIAGQLNGYVAGYFKGICMEHMEQMNERGMLPFVYERSGEWVGKVGNIDIIAQDEKDNTLLALCNYEQPVMTYDDYERLLYCAAKARLRAGYVFLYSTGQFDERLQAQAAEKKNITLVSMQEL